MFRIDGSVRRTAIACTLILLACASNAETVKARRVGFNLWPGKAKVLSYLPRDWYNSGIKLVVESDLPVVIGVIPKQLSETNQQKELLEFPIEQMTCAQEVNGRAELECPLKGEVNTVIARRGQSSKGSDKHVIIWVTLYGDKKYPAGRD